MLFWPLTFDPARTDRQTSSNFYHHPRSKLPIIGSDRIYIGISQIRSWSDQIQVELNRNPVARKLIGRFAWIRSSDASKIPISFPWELTRKWSELTGKNPKNSGRNTASTLYWFLVFSHRNLPVLLDLGWKLKQLSEFVGHFMLIILLKNTSD